MRRTVLVLGGTGEARQLAAVLAGRADLRVVSSLAGRVREPRLPDGEVRVGGFGGVDGLTDWLRDNSVSVVIDATHPFADTITGAAVQATTRLGVPLVVLSRPGWQEVEGDNWHWADSVPAAAGLLPEMGERVLLTTGRRDLAVFAGLDEHWFLARFVDPPQPPLPKRLHVLRDRGPYTVDGELALLTDHSIDVVVTKDSGGEMTAAKLVAARRLDLPVIVVRRPPQPDVPTVTTVEAAVEWLTRDIAEE